MKTIIKLSIAVFFLFTAIAKAQLKQQHEVFIIGTMHDVPKIVKNAYKPLLKIATEYQPDAIYVERQRPTDSLSLANYESSYFIPLGDSIRKTFTQDPARHQKLLATNLGKMSKDDFKFLARTYAVKRDKANYSYYSYLAKFGIKGSKKPLRNENYDLTAPLAVAMNINYIYAMDHQHETQTYTQMWSDCIKMSREDGQLAILSKHNKRDYRKHILPGAMGNLGLYANRIKTMKRYEITNRFDFRETPCEPCEKGAQVWDRRNEGMAKNIGEQVLDNNQQRAVVIVGAGHVLGIKAELEKQFPEIRVRIIDEK